jgi:hypothetical protein
MLFFSHIITNNLNRGSDGNKMALEVEPLVQELVFQTLVQKTETVEAGKRGEAKSYISPEIKHLILVFCGAICEALQDGVFEQVFTLSKGIANECCDALKNGDTELLSEVAEVAVAGIEMGVTCGGALVRCGSESSK